MSHISIYKYKISDISVLEKVCKEKGYKFEKGEEIVGSFYKDQTAKGIALVQLPKWRYPLVIKDDFSILYDNFGSQTGSMDEFGELLQDYNIEATQKELDYTQWDSVNIETMKDGSKVMEMIIY